MRLALAALAVALASCATPSEPTQPSCRDTQSRVRELERDRRGVAQAVRDALTDYRTDVRRLNERLSAIDAELATLDERRVACGIERSRQ